MFVLFCHIPESLRPRYLAEGDESAAINFNGLLSEYSGFARENTLRSVLLKNGWNGADRVVIVAWSAGVGAPREWLQSAANQSLIAGVLLIDGLHTPGPPCRLSTISGLVQFARNWSKAVVVTNTSIPVQGYASTTDCKQLLQAQASPRPGLVIRGFPGSDAAAHVKQVREVGPELMQSIIRPFVLHRWQGVAVAAATIAALAALVWGFRRADIA